METKLVMWFALLAVALSAIPPEWAKRQSEGKMMVSTKQNDTFPAYVGNGYLATNIGSDTIYVSGLFNGRGTTSPSHRARIQSFLSAFIWGDDIQFEASAIDFEKAVGYTRYSHKLDSNILIEQRTFAHQVYFHELVHQIEISTNRPITITLRINSGAPSADLDGKFSSKDNVMLFNGTIKDTEEPGSEKVGISMSCDIIPPSISLPADTHKVFTFVATIDTTLKNSQTEINTSFHNVKRDVDILATHEAAWATIWNSRVEVSGPKALGLAQAINASLYYILSSIRPDWSYSLSPGSLASNSYNGHTFWDAETWMYPPLLHFYPELAKSVLQYRFDHLDGAHKKAKSYSPPYEGAMFPWESAFTGEEVCPEWAPTGKLEQHISGDIAFAVQQYWYATGDKDWLRKIGFPLVRDIATFWASRVEKGDSFYVINNVIPPDEYHQGNNSAYTNVVAGISLNFAQEAADVLGIQVPSNWSLIARHLKVPFDNDKGYHLEYDGYAGQTIKQADVVLLGMTLQCEADKASISMHCPLGALDSVGYPLMYPMEAEVRMRDLVYYEERTDLAGPAMTFGMHCIAWLEVGSPEKAQKSFADSYLKNIKPPYNVWSETPTGGATNFITGAGGFLQAVINGWGGIRLLPNGLSFSPKAFPNGITEFKFNQIWFQKNTITTQWNSSSFQISTIGATELSLTANGQTSRLTSTPTFITLPTTQPISVTVK